MNTATTPPSAPASRQLLLVVLCVTLATGICAALDTRMSVAALALIYLLAVMGTSALLGRWLGVLTSVLSVSAFNYFFVPPRYTLAVDDPEYLLTLGVLLAVSLSINTLVARLRDELDAARQREHQAAQLHALSEQLAACTGAQSTAQHAANWLAATLGWPCAVYLRANPDPASPPSPITPVTPQMLECCGAGATGPASPFHADAAAWAVTNLRPLGWGRTDWPQLPLWCAPFGGPQPGGAVQIALSEIDMDAPPDAATLRHWQALARQIGLSVERERAAALARSAQDSARSEATRNALLAALSHDLRTPLAGILGSASTLREQGDQIPPAQRERLLANLDNEARDMTLMVDNILQLARLSQQPCRIRLQWESLDEIGAVAVQRLRRRWPTARIQWRSSKNLPPLQAEAALLAQVLTNLGDNAARHGGAQAQIQFQAGRAQGGLFIAVRDQGPGLPAGDVQRLFDRWQQGEQGPQQGPVGSAGLGLALCQLIVQAHGGQIEARRCEPGAEFRITLPCPPAPPPPPPESDHV